MSLTNNSDLDECCSHISKDKVQDSDKHECFVKDQYKSDITETLINDYRQSKINEQLIECLRSLKEEDQTKESVIEYLNMIVMIYHNKYRGDIFNKIIKKTLLSDVDQWLTNCFTLSVAFLGKIKDASFTETLQEYIIFYLNQFSAHFTNNRPLMTLVQIFLFAMCNISRHSSLYCRDTAKRLLPYLKQDNNKVVKLMSSYLLVFLFNRNMTSLIGDGDIDSAVNYLKDKFTNMKKDQLCMFQGFVCGGREMKEMKKGVKKFQIMESKKKTADISITLSNLPSYEALKREFEKENPLSLPIILPRNHNFSRIACGNIT